MLAFPTTTEPDVSVVIPLYGGRRWLERALAALHRHTSAALEVIVVDNASPDDSVAWIERHVTGVHLIRNARNEGFGAACNQGAGAGRGRFLCLLNSDAFVQPGWLEPLLAILGRQPEVAIAVPQLLNLDGTLQEAGGLVDQAGNGVAYGSTDNPRRARYQFRRTTDYGSGACLVMRRADFLEIGLFHPIFGLAYCEDLDLAFRWQKAGRYTVYEPCSRVVHVKGASNPTAATRTLIERNTKILRERWSEVLARRPPLAELDKYPHRLLAARDADVYERLLVVAATLPDPDDPNDALGRVVADVARQWPYARVAILAQTNAHTEQWLARGVEVADEPGGEEVWLRHRLLHYSVVLGAPADLATHATLLDETQPQARRVDLTEIGNHSGGALVALMAGLGWAPPPRREPTFRLDS